MFIVVVPKIIRESMGIKKGDKVVWTVREGEAILRKYVGEIEERERNNEAYQKLKDEFSQFN